MNTKVGHLHTLKAFKKILPKVSLKKINCHISDKRITHFFFTTGSDIELNKTSISALQVHIHSKYFTILLNYQSNEI